MGGGAFSPGGDSTFANIDARETPLLCLTSEGLRGGKGGTELEGALT